ncbi:hypothetical protein DFP72DRAFT_347842 [Ephemerocybe angulata]|uniref:Uncharacterized protein n=1 Tax=Ephemerocybe angulata TaxID=980116 RepID=A0A8H6M8I7_9AGAR|nr:hypothetical protein DFP72DRAFT_347842 [Tulosesus angulatus]
MAQAPRLPSRTFKLLEEAQGSVQGEQALLDYLSSEHDIDFMKEMLRPLDPSLIPSGPLPPVGIRALRSAEYKKAQNALKALENSATFFKILSLAPPSESVTASTNMCLTILIDIWPGITEWILYCFMHAHRFMNPATVVGMCAVLLIGVTNNPSGPRGVLREELALMTCTIDILFILLGGLIAKRENTSSYGRATFPVS